MTLRKSSPALIRDLARAHCAARPLHAVPRVLGDGFLCQKNPVFNLVRREVLRRGYRFELDRQARLPIARFLDLERMLRSKAILYQPSARAVLDLAKAGLGGLALADAPVSITDRLLHESAHAIAEDVLTKRGFRLGARGSEARLMKMIVGEAFANATEALAGNYCSGRLHEAFFATSVYIRPKRAFRHGFLQLSAASSPKAAFAFAILAYLFSNALYREQDDTLLRHSFERLYEGRLPRLKRPLRALFAAGQALALNFRLNTVDFYLRYVSQNRLGVRQVRELDIPRLLRHSELAEGLKTLAEVVLPGLET